jgi:hypothetical protein
LDELKNAGSRNYLETLITENVRIENNVNKNNEVQHDILNELHYSDKLIHPGVNSMLGYYRENDILENSMTN